MLKEIINRIEEIEAKIEILNKELEALEEMALDEMADELAEEAAFMDAYYRGARLY